MDHRRAALFGYVERLVRGARPIIWQYLRLKILQDAGIPCTFPTWRVTGTTVRLKGTMVRQGGTRSQEAKKVRKLAGSKSSVAVNNYFGQLHSRTDSRSHSDCKKER